MREYNASGDGVGLFCQKCRNWKRNAPQARFPAEYRLFFLSISSDEFIQAQQQLARWASEDALPAGAGREYFPSPPSSSSGREEPVTVVAGTGAAGGLPGERPRRPPSDSDDTAPSSSLSGAEPPARFPEYKHWRGHGRDAGAAPRTSDARGRPARGGGAGGGGGEGSAPGH